MIPMTNAQAALAAAVASTKPGGPITGLVIERATAFKTWLDENESREGTPNGKAHP